MKCSNFLLKINPFLLVSLISNGAIPASINYYLLLMRYMALFMKVLKLEASYLVFQRFDTVCHDNIVFKLTQNGISENLLNLLHDFLNKKKTTSSS